MRKLYTVDEIKSIASEIANRHGVRQMFLFGSYARGDAKPDSDLDFRIDKGRLKGLFALGGLYADLEEAFDLPIDLLTTESLDENFMQEIKAEEVLIYADRQQGS